MYKYCGKQKFLKLKHNKLQRFDSAFYFLSVSLYFLNVFAVIKNTVGEKFEKYFELSTHPFVLKHYISKALTDIKVFRYF